MNGPWWQDSSSTDIVFGGTPRLNRLDYSKYLCHEEKCRPLALTCETTNTCNNNCIICAQSQLTRDRGTMSTGLFEKVLSDYSDMGGGILALTPMIGDILLDNKLAERLQLLESYPLVDALSVTTNGVMAKLYDDVDLEFILNGFTRIQVSLYGFDEEEYALMTRQHTYGQMLASIDRILKLFRGQLVFSPRPLKHRSPEEVESWLAQLSGFSTTEATVEIQGHSLEYANWSVIDTSTPLPIDGQWRVEDRIKTQCLTPMVSFQIYWNGNVSFCPCADFDNHPSLALGNISNEHLADLYHSDTVRRLWNWHEYGVPDFCRSCSFYEQMDVLDSFPGVFQNPHLLFS